MDKQTDLNEKYNAIKTAPQQLSKYSSIYSGHLDSISTALNFLKDNNISNLSSNPTLQKAHSQYNALQGKLNSADQAKKFLQQRQRLLKEQFEKLGMVKELKQFRKQVYYYQAQVKEYKELFEDPSKFEAKLMKVVLEMPQFKEFFDSNSTLGSLFALPGGNRNGSASLQGLQTRAMLNQSIADRFGTGADVRQMLQQNLQAAQGQLSELRNKINQYGSGAIGSSDDFDLPQGFKPNEQKTKSFLRRLEIGTHIQSQKARYFFAATSDVALSLGYKLNDKSIVGIGAGGKVGWGSGWNHIAVTYEGVSLMSFLDYKIKGSFYMSGGCEMHYRNAINSVQQLQDYTAWQTSGLIGISKKYQLSKKIRGEMKLLWDFMSYRQVPKPQPVVFRIGYKF